MREKYSFRLEGPDLPGHLVLAKTEQERREHVIMKLLSYLLYARPGLYVEPKLDERFQPDLAQVDANGKVFLWIDCGYLAFDKIDKVLVRHREGELVIVKENFRQLQSFRTNALRRAERAEGAANLKFLAFSDGFVQELAGRLGHRHHIELLERGEERLRFRWDGEEIETALHRVGAEAAEAA